MTGKNPSREMEDLGETVLNYAEVKAIATGNPLIKRKMELDLEVQRLRVLESQYRADKYSLEDTILKRLPLKLAGLAAKIKGIEADIPLRDANSGEEFSMKLGRHDFTERKDAGSTLLKAIQSGQYADKVIGYYRGFEIIPHEKHMLTDEMKITLKGTLAYTIELSNSDIGSIARIENGLNSLESQLDEYKTAITETEQRIEASKIQLQRPFEHEETLQATLSELEKVNATLDINKSGDANAIVGENAAQDENDDFVGLEDEEDEDEIEM